VDALATATRELTLEELEARAAEEERREEELRTAYDELAGSVAVQQAAIARLDDDRRVAELAEDGQMQLAVIRAQAREYVRLKVAARMLRTAIERYRSAHQGPILRRANELFPAFTGGSFAELRVDRDEAVLVGRRPDGRRVAVDGMSDGTREQLYLALRLAALERHVELRGPMPVVLDDALLDSDDARAAAILVALADLAERTQVLLFTHHRHLVGLAQRVVDPERLVLHGVDDEVHAGVLPSAGPAAD
jgi:uncharacterized protein YhaN